MNIDDDNGAIITIPGTLEVRKIGSRRGPFNVGTLTCAIGTFTVRDEWLKTFDPGEYNGQFDVSEITLYSYQFCGESRTAIRAVIDSWRLDGEADEWTDGEGDIAFADDTGDKPLELVDDSPEAEEEAADIGEYEDDNVLLLRRYHASDDGEIWRFGEDYRIDSTIGRENICQCRQALVALGYQLNTRARTWFLADEEGAV